MLFAIKIYELQKKENLKMIAITLKIDQAR